MHDNETVGTGGALSIYMYIPPPLVFFLFNNVIKHHNLSSKMNQSQRTKPVSNTNKMQKVSFAV
jgi:hypothetical protein